MIKFKALLIVSALTAGALLGQKKERPFKCGIVPKDYNELKKNYEDFAKPFNRKKGETIAIVGASNGAIEAQISVFIDSINWTIQDIDSSCLNRKNLDKEDVEKYRDTYYTFKTSK
jgi:hypothetical protein